MACLAPGSPPDRSIDRSTLVLNLQMIGQYRAWSSWKGVWVRLLALMDVYLILNDWIGFGYLLYLVCTIQNFLPIVHSVFVIWAFQLLVRHP